MKGGASRVLLLKHGDADRTYFNLDETGGENIVGQKSPMRFLAKLVLIVSCFFAIVASASPNRDALKVALDDLTKNIEKVDDRGFKRAGSIMRGAMAGLGDTRIGYGDESLVWGAPRTVHARPEDILAAAFMAGVLRERIFGDPQVSLHQAWLNVIKYYSHYHANGTIPKLKAVELLVDQEKKGALAKRALEVQAKYPRLFDRLEIAFEPQK